MAKVLLTAFLNSKCNPLVFILGFNPSVSPYCIRQAAGSSGCWGAGPAEAASAAQPALPVRTGRPSACETQIWGSEGTPATR